MDSSAGNIEKKNLSKISVSKERKITKQDPFQKLSLREFREQVIDW